MLVYVEIKPVLQGDKACNSMHALNFFSVKINTHTHCFSYPLNQIMSFYSMFSVLIRASQVFTRAQVIRCQLRSQHFLEHLSFKGWICHFSKKLVISYCLVELTRHYPLTLSSKCHYGPIKDMPAVIRVFGLD